jgi:uncharacterized protein
MYLIDTNIWLERLLDQEKSVEVGIFLEENPSELLFITDFAFHSIGVILKRLDQFQVFISFVQDIFIDGSVGLIRLEPEDMNTLALVMERFRLDFDDSYQYVSAQKNNLMIVSFDSDFDRTALGKKRPDELIRTV